MFTIASATRFFGMRRCARNFSKSGYCARICYKPGAIKVLATAPVLDLDSTRRVRYSARRFTSSFRLCSTLKDSVVIASLKIVGRPDAPCRFFYLANPGVRTRNGILSSVVRRETAQRVKGESPQQ